MQAGEAELYLCRFWEKRRDYYGSGSGWQCPLAKPKQRSWEGNVSINADTLLFFLPTRSKKEKKQERKEDFPTWGGSIARKPT